MIELLQTITTSTFYIVLVLGILAMSHQLAKCLNYHLETFKIERYNRILNQQVTFLMAANYHTLQAKIKELKLSVENRKKETLAAAIAIYQLAQNEGCYNTQ